MQLNIAGGQGCMWVMMDPALFRSSAEIIFCSIKKLHVTILSSENIFVELGMTF